MGGRFTRITIIALGTVILLGALAVFVFLGDIRSADQVASVLSSVIALATLATTFFTYRQQRKATIRTWNLYRDEDFVAAWADLERRLREVAPIEAEQTETVPFKILLQRYERLPEVKQADIQDLLLLLNVRNEIVHPSMRGAGRGSEADNRAIVDAMTRQLSKLEKLQPRHT